MKRLPLLTFVVLVAGPVLADTIDSSTTTTTTTQYESCSQLHTMVIKTSDGVEVPVQDVLIDPSEGRIVTIVTSVDNRLIPLPWDVVHIGENRTVATVDLTHERLVAAPTLERSDLSSFSAERLQKSETFFRSGGSENGHSSAANVETDRGTESTDAQHSRDTSERGNAQEANASSRNSVAPGDENGPKASRPKHPENGSATEADRGGDSDMNAEKAQSTQHPEIGFGGSTKDDRDANSHSATAPEATSRQASDKTAEEKDRGSESTKVASGVHEKDASTSESSHQSRATEPEGKTSTPNDNGQ